MASPLFEFLQHCVERPALGEDAEACLIEAAGDDALEPGRLHRTADEMETPLHLRVVADAGDGRDFPVAEVPGEDEDAFALRLRLDEGVQILDPHQGLDCGRRQPAKLQELTHQLPQVGVMGLRERGDAGVVERLAVDALKVGADHLAPEREQAIQQAARKRHRHRRGFGHRDRRRGVPVVRDRQRDAHDPMPVQHLLRRRARFNLRRAVVVAGHREIGGHEAAERGFAREELQA